MRCDYIAEGVIKATKELSLKVPLVVRLKGTKEMEAKQYVETLLPNFTDVLNRAPM
jgi:succinyl-CoA synthetase beta subunit